MTPTDLAKEALKLAEKIPRGPWMFSPGNALDHWELWNDEESIVQDDSGVEPAKEVLEWFALSGTALPALAQAYLELEERCRLAEAVCELAKDAQHSLEHYEWCDRVKAMKIRREIPPGECDCGVLAFKCAVDAWRSHVTAKKEG